VETSAWFSALLLSGLLDSQQSQVGSVWLGRFQVHLVARINLKNKDLLS